MTSDRHAPALPVPPTPSGRSVLTGPSSGGRTPARSSTGPAADRRGTPGPPAGPAGDAGPRSTGPVGPVKPVGPVGPLIVVTDRAQAAEAGHDLVAVVAAAVTGGARTVLLREKDLPAGEQAALAEALTRVLAPVGGTLLVAGDARLAQAVGAAGVHLSAAQARRADRVDRAVRTNPTDRAGRAQPGQPDQVVQGEWIDRQGPGDRVDEPAQGEPVDLDGPVGRAGRRAGRPAGEGPGGRGWIVGRSCHSMVELRAAQVAGVDYVTFSPVWLTASKPGYGPALGLTGLAEGVAAVPGLPVYALGGIRPGRAGRCQAAGAAGVAVMGEIMRAPDPASVVQALLAELAPSGLPTSRRGPA
jgi:thiamine-phosphate pyrophosphorylase